MVLNVSLKGRFKISVEPFTVEIFFWKTCYASEIWRSEWITGFLERFGIERVANFSIYYGGEGDFLGQRVAF